MDATTPINEGPILTALRDGIEDAKEFLSEGRTAMPALTYQSIRKELDKLDSLVAESAQQAHVKCFCQPCLAHWAVCSIHGCMCCSDDCCPWRSNERAERVAEAKRAFLWLMYKLRTNGWGYNHPEDTDQILNAQAEIEAHYFVGDAELDSLVAESTQQAAGSPAPSFDEVKRVLEYAQDNDWDWTDDELAHSYLRHRNGEAASAPLSSTTTPISDEKLFRIMQLRMEAEGPNLGADWGPISLVSDREIERAREILRAVPEMDARIRVDEQIMIKQEERFQQSWKDQQADYDRDRVELRAQRDEAQQEIERLRSQPNEGPILMALREWLDTDPALGRLEVHEKLDQLVAEQARYTTVSVNQTAAIIASGEPIVTWKRESS